MPVKYLLPKELGGGEIEGDLSGGDVVYVKVSSGTTTHVVYPLDVLTPVAPPTPEEPPNGTILRFVEASGATFLAERDDHARFSAGANRWWTTTHGEAMAWIDLPHGPDVSITPLVPKSAKVELPWDGFTAGGRAISVERDGDQVDVYFAGMGSRRLALEMAREYAYAVLSAAEEG